jgi:hypothetical protein
VAVLRAVDWLQRTRASAGLAVTLLIAANLLPLAGVLFLGWDVFAVLVLYWIENGIVGLLNVIKIWRAVGPPEPGTAPLRTVGIGRALEKAAMIPFFLFHYGLFWVVHGIFVVVLMSIGGALPEAGASTWLWVGLGGMSLLVSHVVSLRLNYIGRGEYRRISPGAQFMQPYPRMVVLHLTIVLGGGLIIGLGQPATLVGLLVLLKTGLDLLLHLREHGRLQPLPTTT